jgi:hypothetical protein
MKNSQKGFVVPLLIGIIALLVIGGGVYIYENKKAEVPVVVDTGLQQSDEVQETNTGNTPVINQQNISNNPPIIKTTPVTNPIPVKSSITVLSPNGQEVWVNGSQQTIRWTSKGSNATQPVEIILERKSPTDTQFWNIGKIATNQTGSGSYTWTVSSRDTTGSIVANSQYKVLIGRNLAKGTGPVDESDNSFLIAVSNNSTQHSITVLSPNGGETWVTGKEYTIKWFDTETRSNVNIYAVNVDRGGAGTNISGNISAGSSGIDDSSSLTWKVGTIHPLSDSLDGMPIAQYPTDPGKYKIMICNNDTKKCDSSDNYFNIVIDSSLAPSITLLSPKNGETVKIGQSFLIQWNTNRILSPGYKFVINAGSGDRALDAYQPSTSYGYYYLVDKYRVTGDILSDVAPGQYKIKVSLYDGVAPKDANGKTCADRVKTGGQLYCNLADQYGKLMTESTSYNYLTVSN